jgi:hypothetical protein
MRISGRQIGKDIALPAGFLSDPLSSQAALLFLPSRSGKLHASRCSSMSRASANKCSDLLQTRHQCLENVDYKLADMNEAAAVADVCAYS